MHSTLARDPVFAVDAADPLCVARNQTTSPAVSEIDPVPIAVGVPGESVAHSAVTPDAFSRQNVNESVAWITSVNAAAMRVQVRALGESN